MKPQFKKCLNSALRDRVGWLGCSVQSQGLDSVIVMSPFQFCVFYDSVILVEDVSRGWNGVVFQPKLFHDYMIQLVTRCWPGRDRFNGISAFC